MVHYWYTKMSLISEYIFHILLLYQIHLSVLVVFFCVCMEFLRFSVYSILSFDNNSFTSSFPIWMPFISSFCLVAVARTSTTVLDKSGERRHLCLVPDLRGITCIFCLQTSLEFDVGYEFVIYGLSYIEVHYVCSHFNEKFYHKWVLDFIKCFYCIY